MSQIINLRADDYVQLSSFTCYLLEAGVQIMEFSKIEKFPGDTCISAYIHANHGLVPVMDLGGVTIHLNAKMCLKQRSHRKETFNLRSLCLWEIS